jgi:hypothetical protein
MRSIRVKWRIWRKVLFITIVMSMIFPPPTRFSWITLVIPPVFPEFTIIIILTPTSGAIGVFL